MTEANTPPADENQIIAERRAKLARMREKGQAFPNDFVREHLAADLQAAHAACPWGVVWDDHEVQNDYAGAAGRGDPDK